jgi:hypothetical protein
MEKIRRVEQDSRQEGQTTTLPASVPPDSPSSHRSGERQQHTRITATRLIGHVAYTRTEQVPRNDCSCPQDLPSPLMSNIANASFKSATCSSVRPCVASLTVRLILSRLAQARSSMVPTLNTIRLTVSLELQPYVCKK